MAKLLHAIKKKIVRVSSTSSKEGKRLEKSVFMEKMLYQTVYSRQNRDKIVSIRPFRNHPSKIALHLPFIALYVLQIKIIENNSSIELTTFGMSMRVCLV